MLPLLVLVGTIAGAWYLLIVRPQKDQQTRHGQLVERLQVGDHVLTVGGIYGRVVAVEQSTVVLELAPGLTSRIATDGIARIVHAGEAAIPTHAPDGVAHGASPTPRQALEHDMHEHSDPQHQQQPAPYPAAQLPPQPYAMPPQPMQPQHVAPQVAPPQLAAPPTPAAPGVTTLRAQVLPALPTFEPRPWGDIAPRTQAQPAAWQPTLPAPPQLSSHPAPAPAAQYQQSQPTIQQPVAYQQPAPMPLHAPFATHQATPVAPIAHHQYAPQATMPVQPAPQPQYAAPVAMPVQPQYAAPVAMPVQPQYTPAAPVVPTPADAPVDAARRHSRAPKGMGSSLRLDDPSLAEPMGRARSERAGLADEYRKLTAPLVAVDEPVQMAHAPGHAPAQPVLVGHDPHGVPLFATPGMPGVQPIAHYPGPAHPPVAPGAMPRPVVHAPAGVVDPALSSTNAFQRRTPYAPGQAAPEAPVVAHA